MGVPSRYQQHLSHSLLKYVILVIAYVILRHGFDGGLPSLLYVKLVNLPFDTLWQEKLFNLTCLAYS